MGISVTCCVSDTSAFSISSNPLSPEFCLHFTERRLRLGEGRGRPQGHTASMCRMQEGSNVS